MLLAYVSYWKKDTTVTLLVIPSDLALSIMLLQMDILNASKCCLNMEPIYKLRI